MCFVMNNWQPIETAPKDGTRILVNDGCDCYVAWWLANDKYNKWFDFWAYGSYCDGEINDYLEVYNAIEWQPLPEIENE